MRCLVIETRDLKHLTRDPSHWTVITVVKKWTAGNMRSTHPAEERGLCLNVLNKYGAYHSVQHVVNCLPHSLTCSPVTTTCSLSTAVDWLLKFIGGYSG